MTMMVTIIIITLTMAMMMIVIIFIIMKIVRVRWLMITMERWMRRLMINLNKFFAHSEVRGPTNKLEACRSVMIFGGCRSVDQEERHQVLVEHHED